MYAIRSYYTPDRMKQLAPWAVEAIGEPENAGEVLLKVARNNFV